MVPFVVGEYLELIHRSTKNILKLAYHSQNKVWLLNATVSLDQSTTHASGTIVLLFFFLINIRSPYENFDT